VPYAKQSSAKAKRQKINNRWASGKEIMRKKQHSLAGKKQKQRNHTEPEHIGRKRRRR
jgi:hypothetical protein